MEKNMPYSFNEVVMQSYLTKTSNHKHEGHL